MAPSGPVVTTGTKHRSDKELQLAAAFYDKEAQAGRTGQVSAPVFMVLEERGGQTRGEKSVWPRTANSSVQTGGEISVTVTTTVTHLPLSVTEKTSRKPSPVLMYCSLMAPNSSCPAVSRTAECVQSRTSTHIGGSQQRDRILFLEHNTAQRNPAQCVARVNTYWCDWFPIDHPWINGSFIYN